MRGDVDARRGGGSNARARVPSLDDLGPAMVWWRQSDHVALVRLPGDERYDASRGSEAWVPGLRATGRIMTPTLFARLAMEVELIVLRTAAVSPPESGFSWAARARDGLSLITLTAGLARRP